MKHALSIGILLLALLSPAIAADSSVPGMGNASSVAGTDGFYCIQSSGTLERQCTITQLSTYLQSLAVFALVSGSLTTGDLVAAGPSGSQMQDTSALSGTFANLPTQLRINTVSQAYLLTTKQTNVGFPVPALYPSTGNTCATACNIAFDLFPKGAPGDNGANGTAWIDIDNADAYAGDPARVAAHVAVFANGDAFFGTLGLTGGVPGKVRLGDITAGDFATFTLKRAAFATSFGAPCVTIASLPTSPSQGDRACVTNGVTSPSFLGTVSTTGSTVAPVMYNGSAWVYG